VTNETITADGHILYEFGSVTNWARGEGVLFYHDGLVYTSSTYYWTEGKLVPVSPIVLDAVVGSKTAVLSGLAKISLNCSVLIKVQTPTSDPCEFPLPRGLLRCHQSGKQGDDFQAVTRLARNKGANGDHGAMRLVADGALLIAPGGAG
jgi:hypothetical protein